MLTAAFIVVEIVIVGVIVKDRLDIALSIIVVGRWTLLGLVRIYLGPNRIFNAHGGVFTHLWPRLAKNFAVPQIPGAGNGCDGHEVARIRGG